MKGTYLICMYADMRLFTPWISIIEDAPNYRIPERMQIGTSLLPFFTPLYFPHVLPKLHPLSSTNHQLSYQEDMRLKDKKEKSNESDRKREEKRERGWKCVDGYEERWESKVDREKIGKRGLKGLLRDGNIFGETRTSKDEKKDIVRFDDVLWNRKAAMMVMAKSSWGATAAH